MITGFSRVLLLSRIEEKYWDVFFYFSVYYFEVIFSFLDDKFLNYKYRSGVVEITR